MLSTELASISSPQAGPFLDQLRLPVIAYLARFKGSSREHTGSEPVTSTGAPDTAWPPGRPAAFEATSADIADLGEEHGHRVLRVCGKGTKNRPGPAAPAVGAGHRPCGRRPHALTDPAKQPRHPNGPARRYPPPAPTRQRRRIQAAGDALHCR